MNTITMRARATDPITSINAAAGAAVFAQSHSNRIMAVLGIRHQGMTAAEIGDCCGLTVVQVDRRMVELQRAGLAHVMQKDGEDLVRGNMRVWSAS